MFLNVNKLRVGGSSVDFQVLVVILKIVPYLETVDFLGSTVMPCHSFHLLETGW